MENHEEIENSLVYTDHTKCTHKDMHYCNKCYHRKMLQDKNFTASELRKDLFGNDRMIKISKKNNL